MKWAIFLYFSVPWHPCIPSKSSGESLNGGHTRSSLSQSLTFSSANCNCFRETQYQSSFSVYITAEKKSSAAAALGIKGASLIWTKVVIRSRLYDCFASPSWLWLYSWRLTHLFRPFFCTNIITHFSHKVSTYLSRLLPTPQKVINIWLGLHKKFMKR